MKNKKITFIDLFSGIGGFRIAFESVGATCVFSSDIDKYSNKVYFENFKEKPQGDITKISSRDIPDHDILSAGFPCQPFSIGGRRLGFSDTRGTLFFEIERIISDKKPKSFILENVKGLVNHDKGNTFSTIKKSLSDKGYNLHYKIINSKDFGLPQNRERIFIIGFKNKVDFKFPIFDGKILDINKILEKKIIDHEISSVAKNHIKNHLYIYKKHKTTNDNFPIIATEVRPSRCTFRNDGISPCLTAKMGTGGNNVPIIVKENRKLTVRECLRLQGFPDEFRINDNYSQSYKQIGNSVSIPVVTKLAEEMVKFL
tara:strand:- start:84 stop:1025 length:942 start_codon:yes stop_codon:yes gene_type:complete